MTVGALAERAGISPRTIKHWEELLKKNKKEIQNLRGNARSAREKKGKAVA
ncbi:MAG TPA: MerR family transcriptional regulator [bacterium]|nr:MerR family transcriptional regulator [bacterium]